MTIVIYRSFQFKNSRNVFLTKKLAYNEVLDTGKKNFRYNHDSKHFSSLFKRFIEIDMGPSNIDHIIQMITLTANLILFTK